MNKQPIYIKVNLFDMNSSVYLPEEEGMSIPTVNIAAAIPQICYEYNTYDVILDAAQDFIDKIREDVAFYELRDYSINKINIKGVTD